MFEPSLFFTSQPHGTPPRPARTVSLPVSTASTPGIAEAAVASIEVMPACAYGDRTKTA